MRTECSVGCHRNRVGVDDRGTFGCRAGFPTARTDSDIIHRRPRRSARAGDNYCDLCRRSADFCRLSRSEQRGLRTVERRRSRRDHSAHPSGRLRAAVQLPCPWRLLVCLDRPGLPCSVCIARSQQTGYRSVARLVVSRDGERAQLSRSVFAVDRYRSFSGAEYLCAVDCLLFECACTYPTLPPGVQ